MYKYFLMKWNAEKLANNRWNGNFSRLNDIWIVGLFLWKAKSFYFSNTLWFASGTSSTFIQRPFFFVPIALTLHCNHLPMYWNYAFLSQESFKFEITLRLNQTHRKDKFRPCSIFYAQNSPKTRKFMLLICFH